MPTITLFNFCDFPDYQITLPDSGIILLDGHSGAGKSTMFQAMAFVIHDQIKSACYPRSDDSKSKPKTWVKVEWPLEDLTIFRQRRPNLLIVQHQGVEYRDDVAQGWIDSLYGSANRWQAASYREQDTRWSFLDLSSGEKLQVLQEIAGDAWSPAYGRLYDYTTQLIRKAESDFRDNTLQKSVEQKTYDQIRSQVPPDAQLWTPDQSEERKIKYTSSMVSLDTYLADVQRWYTQHTQECRTTIEHHQAKITEHKSQVKHNEQLTKDIQRYTLLLNDLPPLNEPLTSLEERLSHARAAKLLSDKLERRSQILLFLSSVETQLSKITVSQLPPYTEIDLQSWKHLLQTTSDPKADIQLIQDELAHREAVKVLIQHEQLTTQSETLQAKITMEKTKLQTLETTLNNLPSSSKVQSIGELNQELYKNKLQQSALTCPQCESRLYLNSGILQSLPSVERSIEEVQAELQALHLSEQQFNQRSSIEHQIKHLTSQITTSEKQLESTKQELEAIHLPSNPTHPTKYAKYTVGQLSTEEQRLQTVVSVPCGMPEIQKHLLDYQQLNQKALLIKQQQQATFDLEQVVVSGELDPDQSTNIDQLTAEIQRCKQVESQRAEYQSKITVLTSQIVVCGVDTVDHETVIQEAQTRLTKVNQDYQAETQEIRVQQTLNNLQVVYDRYMKLLTEESQLTHRIAKLSKIKSILSLAEYSILDSVLNRINRKINKYLSQIFVEPISVQLRAIREEKTTERLKAEVNLQITFGGSQFKSLTSLSGGQRSRVYLAFCMAFARLSYTPYILLDECTASLDADIKEMVIQTLTDSFVEHPKPEKRRLIYITHHDTTEGVYTTVVKLKSTNNL